MKFSSSRLVMQSEVILNELMELKSHIENTLPSCVLIISEPTIRLDSAKASLTIKHINEKLRTSNRNVIRNGNITKGFAFERERYREAGTEYRHTYSAPLANTRVIIPRLSVHTNYLNPNVEISIHSGKLKG